MKKLNSIFVIEDSKILLEIISLQLKHKFNCSVFTFENGEEVIEQMEKIKPELIVLDYNFSGETLLYTNGLQLLKEIRKTVKTPVIVFSGQVKKEIALNLIKNGANEYISKDNDDFMSELIASISNNVE